MITSLEIKGFRCFEHLRVPGLTRVNLIVGTNNAGKTSILEAVEAVVDGTVSGIIRGPRRREEATDLREDDEVYLPRRPPYRTAVSHIFYGHRCAVGTRLRVEAATTGAQVPGMVFVECRVDQALLEQPSQMELPADETDLRLVLSVTSSKVTTPLIVEISPSGGITSRIPAVFNVDELAPPVRFTTMDVLGLARLWDDVNLTDRQTLVLDALRIIEPRTEGLAFQSSVRTGRQGSVRVKLAQDNAPLPLGSLGDGSKRLLALALHMVNAGRGVLLVDEIDTGLHFSVMAKMWQLVIGTARRLDTQVFATTHSSDCVRALVEAAEKDPEAAADISLHRIDPGEPETMRYSADRLIGAIEYNIEVR